MSAAASVANARLLVVKTSVTRRTSSRRSSVRVMASVAPSIIVGGGRVGQALADMGVPGDVIMKRGDAFPAEPSTGPIYVCTRNDALQGVIDQTPEDRRGDLVFLQNGMLQPWLDARGLGANTQVLIYFAVAKFGEKPTDGITDVNPEGLTAANGKHAAALQARLAAGSMKCHVLDDDAFKGSMFEKLIWICAFMAVGAAHPGASVGDVESTHKAEVVELIEELLKGSAAEKGVACESGAVDRLCAYARAVAHFPTAVKEFEWRNGFFYGISQEAIAAGRADPFPKHTALLKQVGAV